MDTAVAAPTPLVPATPSLGARLAALPMRSKLFAAAGVLALLGVVVMMSSGQRHGDYRALYPSLSERDGGPILEKLAQMSVPYRIAEGSGTIMVPASQVYELRMKLSASGLPKGSVTGYELLDKTPFGQTQTQEHTNNRRALEGELTRTIQSLNSVAGARVLLALPQQNGFFREQQKPSASVALTLHPGRTLDAAQIAGIVHLVASSVPDLNPKAVSIVDANGNLLSQPADASAVPQGLNAQQVSYLREVEATHLKRVLKLLEPVVGAENVRATVTADVDFSQIESTAEEFKPNQGDQPAAVSAVRVQESTGPGAPVPTGVPGATSNQPQAAASAPINANAQQLRAAQTGIAGGGSQRQQETRYEVDKKVSVTRNATGIVRRLNAAVVVNHRGVADAKGKVTPTPLTPEEIEKLTALVQEGIGFNKERGDSVRVINAPFHVQAAPPAEVLPWWKEPGTVDLLRQFAMPAALALAALALVFGVIRPALKPAFTPPAPPPTPAAGTALNEVVGGDPALPGPEAQNVPALPAPESANRIEAARAMAKDNPAAVANVLRGWVSGEAA